jgi:hypothetical protein
MSPRRLGRGLAVRAPFNFALTELVMAGLDPAIGVFGARSPDRRSAFASLVQGGN